MTKISEVEVLFNGISKAKENRGELTKGQRNDCATILSLLVKGSKISYVEKKECQFHIETVHAAYGEETPKAVQDVINDIDKDDELTESVVLGKSF